MIHRILLQDKLNVRMINHRFINILNKETTYGATEGSRQHKSLQRTPSTSTEAHQDGAAFPEWTSAGAYSQRISQEGGKSEIRGL